MKCEPSECNAIDAHGFPIGLFCELRDLLKLANDLLRHHGVSHYGDAWEAGAARGGSPKPPPQMEGLLKGEAFPLEPCVLEAPDGSRAKVWIEHREWTPAKGGETRLMLRVHDQELT